MNERIRELDKQARIWAMDNTIFPISSHIPSGYTEKFAELIVQECLTFIEPMPGSGDIDDLALEAACEGIKEHFGVKL